jgi:cytochrome c biogenesis protein CcmG/thiol:disulfide interchange protein DsbE
VSAAAPGETAASSGPPDVGSFTSNGTGDSSEVARDDDPPPGDGRWWTDRRFRALAVGVAAAGLLAFLLFGVIGTGSGSSGQVVPVGSDAPDFTLPALTGGPPVHLAGLGRARHRPVVLNFFASWCAPCRQETPLLATTARGEQRAGSPVQFVGVDVSDLPSSARAFVQQAGVGYPIGVDDNLTVTSGRYGLTGEPQTFFLDSNGKVVAHKLGALSRSELQADLQQITGT